MVIMDIFSDATATNALLDAIARLPNTMANIFSSIPSPFGSLVVLALTAYCFKSLLGGGNN